MARTAYAVALPLVSLLLFTGPPQSKSRIGRLDSSRAFYFPAFAADPKHALAKLGGEPITSETYLRYLANLEGERHLEDLAFDLALELECKRRGLLKSAPVLARGTAAARFHESGRKRSSDPDGSLQRKFANEAMRQLRVDTLVRADRQKDPKALEILFERRYGVGGQKVTVRQILVSFAGARRRAAGPLTADAARAAAEKRAKDIRSRLASGGAFGDLVAKSDDRQSRADLRDPERAAKAGIIEGYNYQRYGAAFATAVRGLDVGAVSDPVESSVGFHVITLIDRKTTVLADVADALRRELGRGKARPIEVRDLRRRLLASHGYEPSEKR